MSDKHNVIIEDFDISVDVFEDVWADFKPAKVLDADTKANLDLANIKHCPRCAKPLVKALSISGSESESWLECPECGTLINTFRPTHYQTAFLSNDKRYKMAAGGFGSGKSRVNMKKL